MTRVYLSLGSNLGDRLALLRAAVQRLRDAADVELVTASPLYESEPWEEEPGRASSEQRRTTSAAPRLARRCRSPASGSMKRAGSSMNSRGTVLIARARSNVTCAAPNRAG